MSEKTKAAPKKAAPKKAAPTTVEVEVLVRQIYTPDGQKMPEGGPHVVPITWAEHVVLVDKEADRAPRIRIL